MAAFIEPKIVVEVAPDFPAAGGDYIRSTGYGNDNEPANYQRVWKYGSTLYALAWDYNGDTTNGSSPIYFKRSWIMSKSTNSGATWTRLDTAGQPVGGNYGTSPYGEAAVLIGSTLWLFFDYGEHPEVSPGVYGAQFDEIRVIPFDLTTDTWGATVSTGCPQRSLTSTSLNVLNNMAVDACDRGGGEIVVFHFDTDETASPQRSMYSVFDTGSAAWTSTSNVVFISSTSTDVLPERCIAYGSTVRFFAKAADYATTGTGARWTRELNGTTLGTVTDLFASWPSGWKALTADYQNYNGFVMVFGSEVIFVQPVWLWAPSGAPSRQWKIAAFRAPSATSAPTWTVEDIGSTDWDSAYAGWGQSGTPCLVASGSDLYCLAGGFGTYTAPSNNRYGVYAQRYAGSGTWDAPVELWSELDAYGFGYGGIYQENEILKWSAIGDLSGADLNQQIGWIGTLTWAPSNKDTVRFWRGLVSTCCCANYAY